MNRKIIIGIIILAAISILVYLYVSGFFGGAGTLPGVKGIEIPTPPPLPE